MSVHPTIASKTTFHALAVDSGEESDEEEAQVLSSAERSFSSSDAQTVCANHTFSSISQAGTKPSKSAIKRAQKQARIERKQKQKALIKALHAAGQSEAAAPDAPTSNLEEGRPMSGTAPFPGPSAHEILPENEECVRCETSAMTPSGAPVAAASTLSPVVSHPGPPPVSRRTDTWPVEPKPVEPQLQDQAPQEVEKMKKRQSFITRTLWTFIMIGGFIGAAVISIFAFFSDRTLSGRLATHGSCLYDSPCHVVSDTCLSGGYCFILFEISKPADESNGANPQKRPLE